MRVALGTVEITDFQARAISLAVMQAMAGGPRAAPPPKFPVAASRQQCREWLLVHGQNGLGAAEEDLGYLKARLDARDGWRRGQPEVQR